MITKPAILALALTSLTALTGAQTSSARENAENNSIRSDAFIGKSFCTFQPVIYGGSPLTCITFLDNGVGKEIIHYEGAPYEYTFAWQYKIDVTSDSAIAAVNCPALGNYGAYREMHLQNLGAELRVNHFWRGRPSSEFTVYKLSQGNGTDRNPIPASCNL